jgi:cobalt-zinc-cadmium efflux system outer membrane protein
MKTTLFAAVLLAACAPSHRAVYGPVDREVERRVGIDPAVPAAVRDLLKQPLDLDAAIRIGLAENQHLRARYDELGIAASEIAAATVLAPLEVDASYKMGSDSSEIELDAVQDILGLLQIGQRRGAAKSGLAAARARAVAATVELVAQIETAFVAVVAAQEQVALHQTAFDAAAASAEVIERMHAAGNTTDLALAREQDQREQARLELDAAGVAAATAREDLNAVLGLDDEAGAWTTVEHLPELPAAEPALDALENDAVAASLELEAIRHDADAASGRLGEARVRAWLPGLGVGVSLSNGHHDEWAVGPAVRIGLPIFDQQQGPRRRARAELAQARHLAAAVTTDVRAHARATRARTVAAYRAAVHIRDVVLPLRQEVVQETLKQYNAMNASTFELLAAKRELVAAGAQYVDAVRDYWQADAEARALARGGMP